MAKQFKKYTAFTTDSTTGELTLVMNENTMRSASNHFTYPAEFSEAKVRKLIAAKLNRADDAVFLRADGIVEFD